MRILLILFVTTCLYVLPMFYSTYLLSTPRFKEWLTKSGLCEPPCVQCGALDKPHVNCVTVTLSY
jgi:hypothetical protein